jgi:hypothetical protein
VHASLAGEVKRRRQALKDAGNVADIDHYAALRCAPDVHRPYECPASVQVRARSRLYFDI